MQGFRLAAITDVQKTKLHIKIFKVSRLKYRSRVAGQVACLKGMSRTITMQGFTLAATPVEIKPFTFNTPSIS